jgi:hypothetical protein
MLLKVGGSTVASIVNESIKLWGKKRMITRDANSRWRFYYDDLTSPTGWTEVNHTTDYTHDIGSRVKARVFFQANGQTGAGVIEVDNLLVTKTLLP